MPAVPSVPFTCSASGSAFFEAIGRRTTIRVSPQGASWGGTGIRTEPPGERCAALSSRLARSTSVSLISSGASVSSPTTGCSHAQSRCGTRSRAPRLIRHPVPRRSSVIAMQALRKTVAGRERSTM
jgi:hypothetical protein